jgi:hypothetical protein
MNIFSICHWCTVSDSGVSTLLASPLLWRHAAIGCCSGPAAVNTPSAPSVTTDDGVPSDVGVPSTTQKSPYKIFKTFVIEVIFHLSPVSMTPVVHLELRIPPRIYLKKS